MRPRIIVAILALGHSLLSQAPIAAQSLDVGGIELSLGQDVSDALARLSSYRIQYNDQGSWYVTQKVGDSYDILGTFSAKNGKISYISKSYSLSTAGSTPEVYTRAARDVRRRGGDLCIMRDVEYTDSLIHSIKTSCGVYELDLFFSTTFQNTAVNPGISISIRSSGS